MKKIVLASASPRRAELLRQIGLSFTVDAANEIEAVDARLAPHELAHRLSLEKAKAAAARHPDSIIIAADTFGVLRGKLIGKPRSAADARRILRSLSGRSHLVITGFTVMDTATGRTVTESVETRVRFRKLTDGEIDAYVASGEPLDKAGAYGIQGLGAVFVERIEGDYFNVVGLPLAPLAEALKKFEVEVLG